MTELESLKKRVEVIEAKEAVTKFMYEWAYWADKIERDKKRQDVEYLANELMTSDGTCDFSAIPNLQGIWGPDKQDIINKFITFAQSIGWAYHIYPNAMINMRLEEGLAEYYTHTEFVPLTIQGQGQFLFLQQNSELKLVGGQWKMHRYRLSNLRQVQVTPVFHQW